MTCPSIQGEAIPPPISEVSQAGFNRNVIAAATSRRLASPLALQKYLWPIIIRGRSVVCVSKRNSGKTVGYILPVLTSVIETQEQLKDNDEYGPIALILVSSPLAAKRVGKIVSALLPNEPAIKCVLLHSEVSERVVYSELLNGCSILVATPKEFLKALLVPQSHRYTFTNLRRIAHFVIDEAEILLSDCRESITNILREISHAVVSRQGNGGSSSVQFIVTASEWNQDIDEFYQSLALYQPILIKGNEEKPSQ